MPANDAPKAVYARISDDAEATGAGVDRQLADCRTVCGMRGWGAETYVDNDVSAYKRSVVRPEFERMMKDLREGRVSGVVVYNLDRLARQPKDLERMIDVFEDVKGLTFSTVEGDVNLGTSDGIAMARIAVTFAHKASADTGRRTKRKHLELAQAGEPVGRRTFGWKADKRTLDPAEAKLARQMVADVLTGVPLRVIVRQWNEGGVKTTTGGLWSHQALRKYLKNARLVGERWSKGEPVLDAEGHVVRGTWEPLLNQDTWDRLQLFLEADTPAVGPRPRRGARKYHLTGLLRCGRCNGLMFGSNAREPGRFNYMCGTSASTDPHTLAISGTLTDSLVDAMVFKYLERESVERRTGGAAWAGEDRLAEVVRQIDDLMGAFQDGTLSKTVVFPRVSHLEGERGRLTMERKAWLLATTGPQVKRETPDSWKAKTPEQRRASADRLLQAIYVLPAERRGAPFNPERLVPVWTEELPEAPVPSGRLSSGGAGEMVG